MDATAFSQILQQLYVYVIAAGIATARVTPIVMILPVFTRLGLSGMLRGGVVLALALPIVIAIAPGLGPNLPPLGQIAPVLIKEPVIGIVIALVLGVPFWAAEAAGDVVDYQRASAFAGLADPASSTEQSVTGALLSVVVVALFFASGGLDILLNVIYKSYDIWPATRLTPVFDRDAGLLILGILDDMVRLGIMLAVPLMVGIFVADVLLAVLARAAPNMHVFDLSLSVKSLVLTLLIVLYASFLARYMGDGLRRIPAAPALLERLAPPATNR